MKCFAVEGDSSASSFLFQVEHRRPPVRIAAGAGKITVAGVGVWSDCLWAGSQSHATLLIYVVGGAEDVWRSSCLGESWEGGLLPACWA